MRFRCSAVRVRDPRHTVTPHQAPYLVRISTYTLHISFLTTLLHVQSLLDQCVVALERRILRFVACQARVYFRHLIDPQRAISVHFFLYRHLPSMYSYYLGV